MKSRSHSWCKSSNAWWCATVPLFLLLICGNAIAQETRESDITRKQVAKAKTLAPYKPNKVENLIVELQQWGLVGVPRGLYPILFGSAFPSGGSAFGGGYRKMFADTGAFDVHGAITPTSTKVLASSLRLPRFAEDRLDSILILKYQDAPEVAFFGIGNDSSDENETNYAFTPSSVRLAETLDVSNFIRVGGEIAYEKYDTAVGESTRVPPIEEEFSPDEVPGLGLDSKYFVGSAFFQFDWRPSPGYATSGGSYRLDWSNYSQQDGDGFNFNRLDVELVQHVPVLRANQIFSFRGLASFTDVEEGQQVPFYLLPKLGGGKDLRGFHDFRFMDRHLMLLAAEYRWTPSKFMDMAVFYEVGKVAPETSDLNFEDLHESYGIGARFHTPYQTALRIEFAISKESKRIIFSGGPSF